MKDIINAHNGKTAWVIANGPSTRENLKYIFEIANDSKEREKHIFFVCNDIDQMLHNIGSSIDFIKPNYWVMANSIMTIQRNHNDFNKIKPWNGKILYANSVDWTINSEKYLQVEFLPYDQRHFDKNICPTNVVSNRGCCKFCKEEIQSGRLTIQEELQQYTNHNKHYGTGSTVALHMLSFAIIMGCNKINVSGVDLNYQLGYFDKKTLNYDSFAPHLNEILSDFKIIKESAENIKDLKIKNLSKISPLKEIFETGDHL